MDWENLFGTIPSDGADGLYVFVRDGHVFLADRSRIDLGVNEAGYLGQNGIARRMSPFLAVVAAVLRPFVTILTVSTAGILKLMGVRAERSFSGPELELLTAMRDRVAEAVDVPIIHIAECVAERLVAKGVVASVTLRVSYGLACLRRMPAGV